MPKVGARGNYKMKDRQQNIAHQNFVVSNGYMGSGSADQLMFDNSLSTHNKDIFTNVLESLELPSIEPLKIF